MKQNFKDSWLVWRKKTNKSITEIELDVEDLETEKLDAPSGGSVGDVLKKTATGTEWGSGGGGSTLYNHTIIMQETTGINQNYFLMCCTIISSKNNAYSKEEFIEYLRTGNKKIQCSGVDHFTAKNVHGAYITYYDADYLQIWGTVNVLSGGGAWDLTSKAWVDIEPLTITDSFFQIS